MNRIGLGYAFFTCALAFCTASKAVVHNDGKPFQPIVDRNLFGLVPRLVEPTPTRPQPPALTIKLTGITTVLGDKRALLKVLSPAQGTEPARETFSILTQGQRAGGLELLEVDEQAGTVRVAEGGRVLSLSLK
jgi:hypothetical protein